MQVTLIRNVDRLTLGRAADNREQGVKNGYPQNEDRNCQWGKEEERLPNKCLRQRVGSSANPSRCKIASIR